MILGVDVGGTFTDFVLLDDAGEVRIHKLLTSADDPSLVILEGVADLQAGPETRLVHGTTIATNALLERRGVRTALVTTAGFRDVLEIGRQTRPELYALHPTRPEPLIPARWRLELPERVDCRGTVLLSPDPEVIEAIARDLLSEQIESVAVCFLFSFLNPSHEQQVRDWIVAAGGDAAPFVTLSSDVLPEYREYERTSTTVINAYVSPLMSRYLSNLEQSLGGQRLRIMQSNGGIVSGEAARSSGARTALSGPAGGVVGAFELARQAGFHEVITFDMGGTSTDVSLCPGKIQETTEGSIAGLPLRLPIIDIHTVGAGGGSIARVDAGGALRVGPESAGSRPGPVCYGRTEACSITVTDANLILGRLDVTRFLGGRIQLDMPRARAQMRELASQMGISLEAAAWGVIRVANSNMERAIRAISIERGYDPRRFVLLAFGGAGPLHACELAAGLRIPHVLIPSQPGVLSALGMVLADVVMDYSQTVMLPADQASDEDLARHYTPLRQRAEAALSREGVAESESSLWPALDMRYLGQSYELTVPFVRGIERRIEHFHTAHQQRFSYASPKEPVEIVNLRLKAIGQTPKPSFVAKPAGSPDPKAAHVGQKQVFFPDPRTPVAARPVLADLYDRDQLAPGNVVVGPAIVFQFDTTSVIPPGWAAVVDTWGNLVLGQQSA